MSYDTKKIRNIALMGHGNSGKTSLAESMLFATGVLDRLGRVTDGNTVCDYDPEEIKRQITISSALAPVEFVGVKINVLDCPGYQDFVGEVLAAIRAVEAGLILCSAKDGLSVGAERCWKYLKAANKPAMGHSTSEVLSPTPPVECLSALIPEMPDRSSVSPEFIMAAASSGRDETGHSPQAASGPVSSAAPSYSSAEASFPTRARRPASSSGFSTSTAAPSASLV